MKALLLTMIALNTITSLSYAYTTPEVHISMDSSIEVSSVYAYIVSYRAPMISMNKSDKGNVNGVFGAGIELKKSSSGDYVLSSQKTADVPFLTPNRLILVVGSKGGSAPVLCNADSTSPTQYFVGTKKGGDGEGVDETAIEVKPTCDRSDLEGLSYTMVNLPSSELRSRSVESGSKAIEIQVKQLSKF